MKYWDFRESGKPQYDYIAYTDGGYRLPKNFGAAACIVLDGRDGKPLYQWSEASRYSTSNRQELAAIIHALLHVPEGSSVLVRSDSENGIAQLSGQVRSKKDFDLVQLYRKVKSCRCSWNGCAATAATAGMTTWTTSAWRRWTSSRPREHTCAKGLTRMR